MNLFGKSFSLLDLFAFCSLLVFCLMFLHKVKLNISSFGYIAEAKQNLLRVYILRLCNVSPTKHVPSLINPS